MVLCLPFSAAIHYWGTGASLMIFNFAKVEKIPSFEMRCLPLYHHELGMSLSSVSILPFWVSSTFYPMRIPSIYSATCRILCSRLSMVPLKTVGADSTPNGWQHISLLSVLIVANVFKWQLKIGICWIQFWIFHLAGLQIGPHCMAMGKTFWSLKIGLWSPCCSAYPNWLVLLKDWNNGSHPLYDWTSSFTSSSTSLSNSFSTLAIMATGIFCGYSDLDLHPFS